MEAFRKWLFQNKTTIVNALLVLATLSGFINATLQSIKSGLQTDTLYQLGMLNNWEGGLVDNTAELIFDTSIARDCAKISTNNVAIKGACGSNNFLLQEAARQRDSLRVTVATMASTTNGSLATYRTESSRYDGSIALTFMGTIFLLMLAFFTNSVNISEDHRIKRTRFFLGLVIAFIGFSAWFFVSAFLGLTGGITSKGVFLLSLSAGIMLLGPAWYWLLRIPYSIGKERNRFLLKVIPIIVFWFLVALAIVVSIDLIALI